MAFTPDPWSALKAFTGARIALGRAGGSLPTAEWLAFRFAHARARDAVWRDLDLVALGKDVEKLGLASLEARSAAPDHQTFLRRPDLGRTLAAGEGARLRAAGSGAPPDVAVICSGGLSAAAVEAQLAPLLAALLPRLRDKALTVSPLILVRLGRVALSDEIGAALGARAVLLLIGERPGLATPASLGAYLTFGPRPGRSDADRNCVSNIHAQGLSPALAAHRLAWLVAESLRLGLSGVTLKDESDRAQIAGSAAAPGIPDAGD